MAKEYSPLKLIKNKVFPSYQLYAVAEASRISLEETFKVCILETLFWIRQKFENLEIPDELKSPSPSHYESYSLEELKTFRIERGYIVDTVYLEKLKSWSFQLVEPDLAAPGGTPVPGRVFTTDISFRINKNMVICAFKTLVAEPENCCEQVLSLRNGVIKRLIRNPFIKLSHFTLPISEKSILLNSVAKIKQFAQNAVEERRCLPLIVFSEFKPEEKKKNDIFLRDDFPLNYNTLQFETINSMIIQQANELVEVKNVLELDSKKKMILNAEKISKPKKTTTKKLDKVILEEVKPYYLYDISDIAKDLMGYAVIYSVPYSKISDFNRIVKNEMLPGDALLIEPKQYGDSIVYRCSKNTEGKLNELREYMSTYHVKKIVDFSDFYFVQEARIIQQKEMLSSFDTLEMRAYVFSDLKKQIEAMSSANKELNKYKAIALQFEDKLKAANSHIDDLKQKLWQQKELLKAEKDNKSNREAMLEIQVEYYKSLGKRPRTPSEIIGWVKKNFSDTIVLHDRAVNLLENFTAQEVNMNKLCDAIEYLATEYSMVIMKKINEEQADKLSGAKYNQKFKVCPSGESCDVKKLSKHYKIKYDRNDGNGRKEYPLDMHLKSGNHSDNLIRIYFNYDSYNKKIVIGSLPKHLPTSTQTT